MDIAPVNKALAAAAVCLGASVIAARLGNAEAVADAQAASGMFLIIATVVSQRQVTRPRSTNATSVNITDGVPFYPSPHTSMLGSAVLGQMRLGSL